MRVIVLMLLVMLSSGAAWAAPIDEAIAADERGDYATALRITRALAEKGEAWAQRNLGVIYERGRGVPKDYAEALKWFRLAAAQGDAGAQRNLGVMYEKGEGVVLYYAEAVKWYRLAAAQGDAGAQLYLGNMYDKGQGVVQDYARAHMWFSLAAVSGDAGAAKNRDIAAEQMTLQQIAEAQKMARECQAKNFKGCD